MGERLVAAHATELTTVPMIPEAEKQRMIRRVATLVVGGWVVYPHTQYSIVETVLVDFRDSPDPAEGDEGTCLEGMEVTADEVDVTSVCHDV